MKKILSIFLVLFILVPQIVNWFNNVFWIPTAFERKVVTFWDNSCKNIKETDIPTIFVPWILASWYSAEWYDQAKVKRWIPDPITHVYDPLFHTFKESGYSIKDVFYKDEFNLEIKWNPKHSLYLFWYDWKKDNKITATLLTQLTWLILKEYESQNWCNIWKVNIIAHSMWWLVARSMLEDMCAKLYGSNNELLFPKDKINWELKYFDTISCKNPFPSDTISENIKVNKFITISTPHRWSPKALPIWEHGDMEMTDWLAWTAIKLKVNGILGFTDEQLYDTIHGFDEQIPNGIVTIWQLLPDLQNKNNYNDKLKYLYKSSPWTGDYLINPGAKYYLDNTYYPKNSFLEELNKEENINKIWDKVDDKFISYYSTITWNNWDNNIVELYLNNRYKFIDVTVGGVVVNTIKITEAVDNTYNIWDDVKDIYDTYQKADINKKNGYYTVNKVIRNEIWLWWDWTVPTYNLKLVPNDSVNSEEIKNQKFESREVKCYIDLFNDWNYIANSLYKDFWINTEFEICNHTNMPIATSQKVLADITWNYSAINNKGISDYIERKAIISNLWYANYNHVSENTYDTPITWDWSLAWDSNSLYTIEPYKNESYWLLNDDLLANTFDVLNFIYTSPNNDNKYSLILWWNWEKITKYSIYQILSPINLLITDLQGRRIGIDPETGMIINEIPWAWTSGDTEGSNEPEFFLIPVEWTWAVEHEIKTYWTWDGEYHIVLNDVDLNTETSSWVTEKLVIAWNAKQAFWEDYTVSIDETWDKTFENLTANINPTIEVETLDIKTDKVDYKFRYNVRWNSENVDKLSYLLYFLPPEEGKVRMGESTENINWILNLNLKDIWKYKLVLELVDKDGKPLQNPEATKTIYIEKQEQRQTITEKINSTQDVNFPEKEMSFGAILDNDVHNVFNLYNNLDNYFDSKIWFGINSSFDAKMSYDEETWNVKVLLPDWEYSSFSLQNDFTYKNDLANDLQLERILNYFKVSSKSVNYYFSPKTYLLEKIEKDEKEYFLHYDRSNRLESVDENKKLLFSFNYDNYNWLLTSIDDKYWNSINFSYEKIGDTFVLSKINNNAIMYNKEWEIKLISWLLNDMFTTNASYSKKLEIIKKRIDSMNLNNYRKKKLMQAISEQKNWFISRIKDEYTKSLVEYFIGEIERYLEI